MFLDCLAVTIIELLFCLVYSSNGSSAHALVALPLLRNIDLLKVLCVLITKLEVNVLYRLLDPLFAADTNNGTDALLDAPARCNTSHANTIFLGDFLDPFDDLLVSLIFTLIDECISKLVCR